MKRGSRISPSIRMRLTLWYILALSLVLIVFSAVFYGLLKSYLVSEVDRKLREDIEAIDELLSDYQLDPSVFKRNKSPDRWILEVWRSESRIYSSQPENITPFGIPGSECQGKTVAAAKVRLPDGLFLRVGCRSALVGNVAYIVRSARSADRIEEELREILLMIALGLPFALLIAAGGGYWLARRALAPVSRMTDQARSITAEHLSERLSVENPDDELGKLAITFNETFQRLERSFEQMRRFTADASHELRTPLTAIRTMGEVALREAHSEEQYREVISSVLEEGDRLRHLVDSLLTLSRADAGQLKLNFTHENLSELALEVIEHLKVLAEEKCQTLTMESSDDENKPVPATVDRAILRQAFINLIDNAIKYSPPGAVVRVRVVKKKQHSIVEVNDNGPGISNEYHDQVFDRFYRIDAGRARAQGGTGLGLSIARWAVEVNGGTIELESAPGAGSTFRIVLPD